MVARRAAERRVMTASNCIIYCFNLLDTVQELCSYHVLSLSVAAWRPPRRGFLAGFFRHFSAAHINYYFASTACLLDLFATDSVNLEECI